MSTQRHIRHARRFKHDPWGPTAPASLDTLGPIEYEPDPIPGLEATELPHDEGMVQWALADALWRMQQ